MPTGVYVRTDEYKNMCKGRIPWNKGKKNCYSKETIEKLSNAKIGKVGRLHSEKTKEKIRNSLLGHKVSEKSKIKMSESHTGKVLSDECKRKLSYSRMGNKNPCFGIKKSDDIKKKIRASVIKYILENGGSVLNIIGKNESELLDRQEKINSCIIDRDFTVLTYKPDGYCHETNTVYEVYERYHDRCVYEDLKRENIICSYLGCDFIIIYDKSH